MDGTGRTDAAAGESRTTVERASERELVVTRAFHAPVARVFEAWTKPELFRRWWAPKSCGLMLLECELDARTGGTYRLVFRSPASEEPMAFFGRYIEATPSRLVWTNDEEGEGGAVTMVTFQERGGETLLVLRDVYASKGALDEAIASGATGSWSEQFDQLAALVVSLPSETRLR